MNLSLKAPLLFSFLLFLSLLPTSAREWTNQEGKVIHAELIEVKEVNGEKKAVLRMEKNGKHYTVPLEKLSQKDQDYIAQNPPTKQEALPPSEEKEKAPSIFAKELEGNLVKLSGRRTKRIEWDADPDYYAFYYSAHWCGPCRKFTPKLVDFYNQQAEAGKRFEIIFVSSDRSAKDMDEYMEEMDMPWLALRYRAIKRARKIKQYAGNSIPGLVLVDKQGKVLSHSHVNGRYRGPTPVMNELAEMLEKSPSL